MPEVAKPLGKSGDKRWYLEKSAKGMAEAKRRQRRKEKAQLRRDSHGEA